MDYAQDLAADFYARRNREQRRYHARKPKAIGNILAQVITEQGIGRIQATADFAAAWRQAAGEAMAKFTRPGRIRRGLLEVTAANSMIIQELTFQKQNILNQLQTALPDAKIRDIRFRVGKVS